MDGWNWILLMLSAYTSRREVDLLGELGSKVKYNWPLMSSFSHAGTQADSLLFGELASLGWMDWWQMQYWCLLSHGLPRQVLSKASRGELEEKNLVSKLIPRNGCRMPITVAAPADAHSLCLWGPFSCPSEQSQLPIGVSPSRALDQKWAGPSLWLISF